MSTAVWEENGTLAFVHNTTPAWTTVETSWLEHYSNSYAQVHGPLSLVVSVLGGVCNVANIVVLMRPAMRTPTNTLLLWLAVADLLTQMDYVVFAMLYYICNPRLPMFVMPTKVSIGYLIFHINFSVVCHSWAIWITVALAVFRYIYILLPARARQLCNIQRAQLSVAVILASTLIVSLPNFVLHTIVPYVDRGSSNPDTNSSQPLYELNYAKFVLQPDMATEKPIVKYNRYLSGICIKFIPCFLLSIFTAILVIEMHKVSKRRHKLLSQGKVAESNRQSETNRITGMLLAVVVLFLITELPQGIMFILAGVDKKYDDAYIQLGDTMDLIALVNNATNFILYCTMGTQFRNEFSLVFCSSCGVRAGFRAMVLRQKSSSGKTDTCMSEKTFVSSV